MLAAYTYHYALHFITYSGDLSILVNGQLSHYHSPCLKIEV